jgi:hypothetical protein
MNEQWYHGQGGRQNGPFDGASLRQLIASGRLAKTDLVWRDGMSGWIPIEQMPELAGSLPSPQSMADAPVAQPVPPPAPPPWASANPGAYPHPMPQGGYYPPYAIPYGNPQLNGKATTSLVLGIVSIVLGCLCFGVIGFGCGIPAIILGKQGAQAQNAGQAKAGFVCGIIGVVLGAISLVLSTIYWIGATSKMSVLQ